MEQTQAPEAGLHVLDYWRVIRSRKEIILAVMLLVVITGVLYTLSLPKMYRAATRIEVRSDGPDVSIFEREFGGQVYNPFFLRTQYEIIQSRPIMIRVAENLDLARRWGEERREDKQPLPLGDAVAILQNSIDVSQFRDTSLIMISATRKNPREAAEIANEIADVYLNQRLTMKRRELTRGLDAIRSELVKQRERVDEAERKMDELRRQLDIVTTGRGVSAVRVDKIRLSQLEADRIGARVEMIARGTRYDQIKDLEGDELIQTLSFMVGDAEISGIRRELTNTDVQLTVLLETLGENHPDVLRLKAARGELLKKMEVSLAGVKRGIEATYEESRARYEALDSELNAVREADIAATGEREGPMMKAERDLELQRQILQVLEARVLQEGIKQEVPTTPVEIVDPAVAPPENRPVSPNIMLNVLLSVLIGLASGVGLAFFIEYLDTSVKTVDDVERFLSLPVIGVIPQKVRPLIEEGPESPYAEAYRVLRTNLMFALKDQRGGAFAVTSGGVGEGKSTTMFNLAYVCATTGDKVLIVDSDLRRPVQHTILGMPNKFGLTNVLMRDVPIEETIKPVPSLPNLHFLPSGKLPRSSVGVLNTQRMRELIKNLKARYDYIFFDSPPMVGVSDAAILASEMDGVLLVVQYRKYPRVMTLRAKKMLENVGAKVVGVVLNNINIMRDDYYYYYHSYYSNYYYQPSSEGTAEGEKKGGVKA